MQTISRTKQIIAAGTLVLAGFGGGAAVAVVGSASADETTAASTNSANGETPLTGGQLDSVTDAVLAEYPDATIERAETDSDGTYEAHILTSAGEPLSVELDENYAITGTEAHHEYEGGHDGSDGQEGHHGPDEESLTGAALDEVTAAVEAEYPNAAIERVETDSDGVYEAHILTRAGEPLTVELDEDYAITGTEAAYW